MSKGNLKCCGSPLYLKSKFGSGYNLILSKDKRVEGIEKDALNDKITQLIKSYVPNSKLNSNINSEISFILPAKDSDKFSALIESIEKEKSELGIVNVGVSVTTIEDVFLK